MFDQVRFVSESRVYWLQGLTGDWHSAITSIGDVRDGIV